MTYSAVTNAVDEGVRTGQVARTTNDMKTLTENRALKIRLQSYQVHVPTLQNNHHSSDVVCRRKWEDLADYTILGLLTVRFTPK